MTTRSTALQRRHVGVGVHVGSDDGVDDYEGHEQSPPQQIRRKRWTRRRPNSNLFLQVSAIVSSPLGMFLVTLIVFYLALKVICYNENHFFSPPPRLPIPNVDIKVPNFIDWPLIHIINTRFMQEQGPLSTLGMARFHLFMTFCFPSIVGQSSQKFFWIIKTDPQFTTSPVFQLLLEAVMPHPNIYVVASNNNYLIQSGQPGSWRDGQECQDLLRSKIYTGNITELKMAMALRDERPILETRLDADDGLHRHYIQFMQVVALTRFQPSLIEEEEQVDDNSLLDKEKEAVKETSSSGNAKSSSSRRRAVKPKWLYWCSRRHIEWHTSLDESLGERELKKFGDVSAGILAPLQHDKLCVTPGMTVGYNVGVDPRDLPIHAHDQLYQQLNNSTACYHSTTTTATTATGDNSNVLEDDGPCLELVEDFLFCAIRSRTWTSAGMRNVGLIPAFRPSKDVTKNLWALLEAKFGVDQARAKQTLDFLNQHRKEIAYENILGQCTTGHSCKEQARTELKRIMEKA